ncbi:MAG: glycosyltransferase [Sediminibacterium sp.]|nr:glycosyltransferase [Sediminibacterium sp.]
MKYNTTLPVSIIIPTFNRLHYLREAMESVLDQTYNNIEIIICDNASSDGTEDFFRNYTNERVRYKRHNTPVSPLDNWNSWLEISRGEIVTFLPDDDKLSPRFVEECLHKFLNNEDTNLVKTGCFIINEKSEVTSSYLPFKDSSGTGPQFVLDRLNPRYAELSLGSGYMFRKADFIKVGGFMNTGFPKMHFVDDYLWYKIALNGGTVHYINEELWSYRDHSANMAIVESLQGFKNSFNEYTTLLLNLVGENFSSFPEISNYIRSKYADRLVRDRILGELSRNRRRMLFTSLLFVFNNKKIIIKYFGISKLLYEFVLCLFLPRWI